MLILDWMGWWLEHVENHCSSDLVKKLWENSF